MAKKRRGGQPAEPFWFCRVRVSAHCVGQRDGPVCKQCLLCTDEPTQEEAKLEHNHDVMQHIKAKGGLTQDDQCSNLFCDQYGCWGIVRKERIADMKCSKFINTGMCEEPPEPEEIASESEGPQSASSEGPSAAQWEEAKRKIPLDLWLNFDQFWQQRGSHHKRKLHKSRRVYRWKAT
jgi:hypothetical protein